MSTPSNHSDSTYPEDGVTHYPRKKKSAKSGHAKVADFHRDQMSHMMNLMRGHAKSKALAKKTAKKK